ncbi:MAG: hypothetical protein M0P14_00830 [Alkaliphilus sp.]|nr:hypothetical protein [Alkaliphilus sp.]
MKILVIDDMRTFPEATKICKTFDEGMKALQEEKWDVLYLDHDLCGREQQDWENKTGYQIACFLEENVEFLPNKVICVSANPVGKKRIKQALRNAYKRKRGF